MAAPRDKKPHTETPGKERSDLPEVPIAETPASPTPAQPLVTPPEPPGAEAPEAPGVAPPEPPAAEDDEPAAEDDEPAAEDDEPAEQPETPLAEPFELANLEEADVASEPWSAYEPLPPLEEILPEHIAYVRTVVARFSVTPTHWREDLIQEVLLQAHRSRESRLDVRALLSGITRHVVFAWMAKRNAERTAVALHPDRDTGTERGAEEDRQAVQRRDAVRAAIDNLPEIFREVFIRAELQYKTMPEIARALGIPVNTGYTRLHIARARFLASLQRILARRRIHKRDLSAPVALGALGALGSESGPAAPPDLPDPAPGQASAPPPAAGPPGLELGGAPLAPLKVGGASLVGWVGAGVVAAAAVAVGVWLARSPEPPPTDPIATPEPHSTRAEPDDALPPATGDSTTSAGSPVATGSAPVHRASPPAPASSEAPSATASATSPEASADQMEALEARYVLSRIGSLGPELGLDAARQFQAKHPNSPYLQQIRDALAGKPPPAAKGSIMQER